MTKDTGSSESSNAISDLKSLTSNATFYNDQETCKSEKILNSCRSENEQATKNLMKGLFKSNNLDFKTLGGKSYEKSPTKIIPHYSCFVKESYIYYDRNLNLGTVHQLFVPYTYFKKYFLYDLHANDANSDYRLTLSVLHLKKKSNQKSVLRMLVKYGAREFDLQPQSLLMFKKIIKNYIDAKDTNGHNSPLKKEQNIEIDNLGVKPNEDYVCEFEKDCLEPSEISNDDIYIALNDFEKSENEYINDSKRVKARINKDDPEDLLIDEEVVDLLSDDQIMKLKEYYGTYDLHLSISIAGSSKVTQIYRDLIVGKQYEIEEKLFYQAHAFDKKEGTERIDIESMIHLKHIGLRYFTNRKGLINEAMTCYMNSMLQLLFSITYFKKSIFSVLDSEKESCIYGLQRVFYDLLYSDNKVGTAQLIKSFGWSRNEIMVQHDIQEFNLALSDSLDKKMKGTPAEGTFKYLFGGKIVNFIKCLNVDYESVRDEPFCDIQLSVKGNASIYEALDNYVKIEKLEGDNQYDAEKFGRQIAEKGVKFKELPPILIFQLKRFEYNMYLDSFEKVNDCFEFYDTLNMSKYMLNDSNANLLDNEYCLHAVVVHSGNLNYGHYYCFIKSHEENSASDYTWMKFNDENVRRCSELEAIKCNYGGTTSYHFVRGGTVYTKEVLLECSAYILAYVRKSSVIQILKEDPNGLKVLPSIQSYITEDIEKENKEVFDNHIQLNNTEVVLIDLQMIKYHTDIGIAPGIVDVNQGPSLLQNLRNYFTMKFPSELTVKDLLLFISQETEIPLSSLHLFKYDFLITKEVLKNKFFSSKSIVNLELSLRDLRQPHSRRIILYIATSHDTPIMIKRPKELINQPLNHRVLVSIEDELLKSQNKRKNSAFNTEFIVYATHNTYMLGHRSSNNFVAPLKYEINSTTTEGDQPIQKCLLIKFFYYSEELTVKPSFCKIYQGLLKDPKDKLELLLDSIEIKTINHYGQQIKQHSKLNIVLNKRDLKINYIVESLDKTKEYHNHNLMPLEKSDLINYIHNNDETDSDFIILVPYLELIEEAREEKELNTILIDTFHEIRESIEEFYVEKYNTVYLNLVYLLKRRIYCLNLGQKMKLDCRSNEKEIKEKIWEVLTKIPNKKDLLSYFSCQNIQNIDVMTVSKKFVSLDLFVEKYLNYQSIKLVLNKNQSEIMNKELALSDFLFEHKSLRFKLKFYYPSYSQHFFTRDISLFDVDHNPIGFLHGVFPQTVTKLKDYTEYLHDYFFNKGIVQIQHLENLEVEYEESKSASHDDQSQICFILQEKDGKIAYQLKSDSKEDITNFKTFTEVFIFRFQPYLKKQVWKLLNHMHFHQLYITFRTKDEKRAWDPIIIPIKQSLKIAELKEILSSIMSKFKHDVLSTDFSHTKLYTFRLESDNNIVKDRLLIDSRDSIELGAYYKPSVPWNVLIEFPAQGLSFKCNDSDIKIV